MSELRTNRIVPRDGLPSGSSGGVIQVRYGFTTSIVNSSTSSYVDSGITATITPTRSDSKVLVMTTISGVQKRTNDTYLKARLLRDSTEVALLDDGAGYTGSSGVYMIVGTVTTNCIDSPATTSSVTYKVQFMSAGGNALVRVQTNSSLSTIVLMEIAG